MTKFFLSAIILILGLVFSHIDTAQNPETGRPLNNFAGVGITQKGMVKGQLSGVKFQVLSE